MKLFTITLFWVIWSNLPAQQAGDLSFAAQWAAGSSHAGHEHAPMKKKPSAFIQNAESEPEIIFSALFLTYKTFFSSQDGSNCAFVPSCSEFAITAVRKHGPFAGVVMGLERFSRCNGYNYNIYRFLTGQRRLNDPVP